MAKKGNNNRNQRTNKGSGSNDRGPRRDDRTYEDFTSPKEGRQPKRDPGDTVNNPEWWTRNGQVVFDSASIPQMNAVGSPLELLGRGIDPHFYGDYEFESNYSKYCLPGVCVFETYHGPGIARGQSDGVNQANLSAMEFIRSQITPNIDYDYPDLAITRLALGEAYAWYYNLRRVYALCRTFTYTNLYLPRCAVMSLGFNYDDLRSKLADFRLVINQFAIALGAFTVPNSQYYERLEALYDNVFIDEESDKAQIYMFAPAIYRTYEYDIEGKSYLRSHSLLTALRSTEARNKLTLSQITTICDTIVAKLRNDDDIFKIFGNIRDPRTWGNNVYAIPQISEDYTLVPKCDLGIMHQIMNAKLWYEVRNTDILQHVEINNSYVSYTPQVGFRSGEACQGPLYDGPANFEKYVSYGNTILTWYGDPYIDAKGVIYYTRFASLIDPDLARGIDDDGRVNYFELGCGGIEVLGRAHIYRRNRYNIDSEEYNNWSISTNNVDFGQSLNNSKRMMAIAAFNYHPTVWFFAHRLAEDDTNLQLIEAEPLQQWENIATIAPNVLENIQWVATYSLWGVDQGGNLIG